MPPPENPRPKPEPKPKPKPKRPKPKPKELRTDPMPARPPWKRPERDGTPVLPAGDVAALHPPPFSCETYPLCPPPRPEAPPAAVHLRSGRIPTPLVAVSASLLALSAVLLLALLARYLVRRRRRRGQQEAAALAQGDNDEESVLGVDSTTAGGVGAVEEEEDVETGDGGVHHVWYIRTKGLDERAIAAIAAVVYDAKTNHGAAGAGANTDGGCAVCLAEFRDGETLRLLPRCGHAFHRGCIDTWLRAHVNCPLCRAPVQAPAAGANSTGATALSLREEEASEASVTGARTEEAVPNVLAAEHAVRRAASMMALPRRAWPDASLPAPASTSARQEEMTGLGKVRMLLKFSGTMDNLAGVGAGRSASFGAGRPVLSSTLPTRSGMSTATGVNGDESR